MTQLLLTRLILLIFSRTVNIVIMSDPQNQQEKLRNRALSVTRWVGSPQSVIIHTIIFVGCFASVYLGFLPFERMLLVLTTIVSLEAIYLSIFIQMTINYTTQSLKEVELNLDEIQEDVAEIQEDVDEIQEDIDEIQEDVEEIQEDVEDIQEEDGAPQENTPRIK